MHYTPVHSYFTQQVSLQSFRGIQQETGVSQIHVSIISGRCGSTFLSHICKSLGFGKGEEPFNDWPDAGLQKVASPDRFDAFLHFVLQNSAIGGRSYFQIDPLRLRALAPLLPAGQGPFPEVTQFTVILRRNIVAQAISYLNAQVSGLWHSNQGSGTPNLAETFSEERVLHWIEHIYRMEKAILAMFPTDLPDIYYYEDIAAMPLETISRFLQRAGFPVDPTAMQEALQADTAPRKIERSHYAVQYLSVIDRFPWLNEALAERSRGLGGGFMTSPTLERMILGL